MDRRKLQKQIEKLIGKVVSRYNPERIILFGSAAKGQFKKGSDLDLLIIKEGVGHLRRSERYYQVSKVLDHELPLDILVYTPSEIKKRLYLGDPFIKKILKEGKVLYGS